MGEKVINKLAPFKFLGFTFGKSSDNINYPTVCPFSDKEGKMYVNSETGQWNSFTSDKSGNILTFLREYYELCLEHTTTEDLVDVVDSRKLPIQVFQGNMAYNPLSDKYLIPIKNAQGYVINLTSWHPKAKKPMKVPGVPLSLIGLEKLKEDKPIYLAEGEWDTLALQWLLDSVSEDAIVLGVPGANTFKDVWIGYFQKRNVTCCYDNDKAGFDGQQKVADKIRSSTEQLKFLIWPELTKTGYDIRDLIIDGCDKSYSIKSLKQIHSKLHLMLSSSTQHERDAGTSAGTTSLPKKDIKIPTREELENKFKEFLYVKDFRPLAVMLGTCFANKISGDPVWLFLVAPPGGSKTEYLMTLNKSPFVETTSTLTPAALVSGFKVADGKLDPSLLKKVNKRMLVVKDLTTMLTMSPLIRDEVFGLLRDAYDGYVEKWFSSHKKSYKVSFGMLAGVTPAIDAYNTVSATMGARAIYYRLGRADTSEDEISKIMASLNNVSKEDSFRGELQDIVYRFLEKPIPSTLPLISLDITNKIIAMSMFTSALRASIIKDKYSGEQLAPVFREVGTRLAKVYKKLAIGLCIYYNKNEVDEQILADLRVVALDTCPSLVLNLIMKIYIDSKQSEEGTASTSGLSKYLNVSTSTISRMLDDLQLQKLIEKVAGMPRVKSEFKVSDYLADLIDKGELLKTDVKKKFYWYAGKKRQPEKNPLD